MYQEEQQPPQKQESISPLKYGLKYLKKYKTKLALAIFCSILFAIIPMQVPVITGTLVDGLTIDNTRNNTPLLFYGIIKVGNTPYEVLYFGFMSLITVAIVYGITSHLRISSRAIVSRNFAFELERELVRKLEFLPLDIHRKYGSGDLLNRVVIDTNNARPFVEASIIKTITNVVRISYPILILFLIDPFIALVASSILPAQYFIIKILQSKVAEVSNTLRKDRAGLTMLVKENLDGIEAIQTSNAGIYSEQKISSQIEKVEEATVESQRYYAMMTAFAWGLTGLGIALTWWLGSLQVLAGTITVGQLVILSGLVVFAYTSVRRLTRVVKDHHRSYVAIRHIQEILETPSSIEEYKNQKNSLKVSNGSIIFRNVSFSYNKKNPVLKNININIEPKRLTAIVGSTGSGKSSILRLISRLYDPSEGQVLIDDQDIRNVSIQSLRSQTAVVTQNPIIFTGTIMDNIKLANPDATDIEVRQACLDADALKFINALPKGFETVIGQGGIHLSGGQAQKIAIARALLKKAEILLLDEPSSAIDPESARSIMNTLNKLKKDMTIVLAAHSRHAINKFDNIITIDSGSVIEIEENGIMKQIEVGGGAQIVYSQNNFNYIYGSDNTLSPKRELKMKYPLRNFVFEKSTEKLKEDMSKINGNNNAAYEINRHATATPTSTSTTIAISTSIITKREQQQISNYLEFKVIGRSANGRGINVILIGENKVYPKLKIFVMAGQHGDEKYSRKAAERLISHLIKTKAKEFSDLCIAILPNANPDGAYKNRRRTSSGIDMNRDHLLLSSEENRAIHSFVRSWKPNLIVDVHTYPPKRKYLEEKNYVFYHDVLIDSPTNLAIQKGLDQDKLKSLIQGIQSDLEQFNYTCDRYVLIDEKGKVRHSTDDIVDARNFLSLRYDVLSILVEGKEPLPEEDRKQIERTITAQYLTLLSILKWAAKNIDFLLDKIHEPSYKREKGDRIAIRCNYIKSEQPFRMNFENTVTKKIEEVTLPDYQSDIKATRHIRLPFAYAIPIDMNCIIEFLHNHGFTSDHIIGDDHISKLLTVQRYLILSFDSPKIEGKAAKNVMMITTEEDEDLSNYEIFSVNQEGGHSLALLLEPQSEYGLHKYKDLNLNLEPGLEYPILRVVSIRSSRRIKGS